MPSERQTPRGFALPSPTYKVRSRYNSPDKREKSYSTSYIYETKDFIARMTTDSHLEMVVAFIWKYVQNG
ncbi:hypothetical protein Plhal304r1_c024g0083611 [Plasmopara halstedii]